jgi:hypothetical protein
MIACATCVVSSSPGAGIAHFAGSTQAVTSSAVSLTADVSGVLPVANGGCGAPTAWTPVDASGASLTFTGASGLYVVCYKVVYFTFALTYPTTANTSFAKIGGLPTASISSGPGNPIGGSLGYDSALTTSVFLVGPQGATSFAMYTNGSSAIQNVTFTGATLQGFGNYFTP